jgi:hypothetical protein
MLDYPRQHKTTQHNNTTHDKTRPHKTRQDKTRQDKARPNQTRPDKTRQDKPSQAKTRQDKTRLVKIRQGKTRQNKTRQDNRPYATSTLCHVPCLFVPSCVSLPWPYCVVVGTATPVPAPVLRENTYVCFLKPVSYGIVVRAVEPLAPCGTCLMLDTAVPGELQSKAILRTYPYKEFKTAWLRLNNKDPNPPHLKNLPHLQNALRFN